MVERVGFVINHRCQFSHQNIVFGADLQRLDKEVGLMYNVDMMGVSDEHPAKNKEDSAMGEDKPPSTKGLLEDTRRSLQSDGSSGLLGRSMFSNSVRNGTVNKWAMVYVHLAPGSKPNFRTYNDTFLHQNDAVYCERR
jgi:hypothetical protein